MARLQCFDPSGASPVFSFHVGFVDQLDIPVTPQQSATQAQLEADSGEVSEKRNQPQAVAS
jgi:hypothetical protein